MAVTQYIGARYVPLFANPIEWESTKTYEPLTVVYNKGNSYTSRQYVPAGIDISNDVYWARTGNYNAQIEQYRSEVATFDGRITTNETAISAETTRATEAEHANATAISDNAKEIANEVTRAKAAEQANATAIQTNATAISKDVRGLADALPITEFGSKNTVKDYVDSFVNDTANIADGAISTAKLADNCVTNAKTSVKKMVAIGDSFTVSPNPYATKVWADHVAEGLGETLYNYGQGSTGFILGRDKNLDFAHQLQSAITEIGTDASEVAHVFIYGGFNDYYALYNNPNPGYTLGDVVNAAYSLIDNAHNAFPNAKIVYIPLNFSDSYMDLNAWAFLSTMCAVADSYPFVFTIANSYAPLYCFPASVCRYSDNVHPNTSGHQILALFFLACLNGNPDTRVTQWNVNYNAEVASSISPWSTIIAKPRGTHVVMNFSLATGTYTAGHLLVVANNASYDGQPGKVIPTLGEDYQYAIPYYCPVRDVDADFIINANGALVINPRTTFTLSKPATVRIDYFAER